MEKAAVEMQYTPNDTSTTKLHSSDWKFGRRSHSNLVRSKAPLLSMPVRAPARFAREKVRRIIMLSNCELLSVSVSRHPSSDNSTAFRIKES